MIATAWRSSFWLMCLISLAAAVTSCSKKTDSSGTEPAYASTSDSAPNSTAQATTSGPKTSVMIITYETQTTPNQYSAPPGMGAGAVRGEEVRYLDLANNRMRLEEYALVNSAKKLQLTMIIDQTGSYRIEPGKNEALFTPMTTPDW